MLAISYEHDDFESHFRKSLHQAETLFKIDSSRANRICGPTLSAAGVIGDVGFIEKTVFDQVATHDQQVYYEGLNTLRPAMARTYYLHVSGALPVWKEKLRDIKDFLSISNRFFEIADQDPLDHDRTDPNELARRILIEPDQPDSEYLRMLNLFQQLVEDAEAHIVNLYGEKEVSEGFDIERYHSLDHTELEEQVLWVEAFIDKIRALQPEARNLLERCQQDFFELID